MTLQNKLSQLEIQDHKIGSSQVFPALLELNTLLASLSKSPVSTEDMESLAKHAWRVHSAYDHRMKQIEQEKAMLKHQVNKMWTLVESVLYPALQMDPSLLPVYKELSDLFWTLKDLKTRPALFVNKEARAATLVMVQTRLHAVEKKKVNGVFMEDQVSIAGRRIPSGQAICQSLMEKCYHLVSYLNGLDDGNTEPPSKLEELNTSLVALLSCLKSGMQYDRSIVEVLKDQLKEIELHKKGDKWAEEDGTIVADQDKIQKQIDLAHDLIHELGLPQDEDVKQMVEKVSEARDVLLEQLEYPNSVTAPVVHTVMDPVYSALEFIEKEAATVANGGKKILGSVVQSALGIGASLLHSISPAGDEYTTLQSVISRLKGLRAKRQDLAEDEFQKELKKLQSEMDNVKVVDAAIKEKDAIAVLKDQARVLFQSLL